MPPDRESAPGAAKTSSKVDLETTPELPESRTRSPRRALALAVADDLLGQPENDDRMDRLKQPEYICLGCREVVQPLQPKLVCALGHSVEREFSLARGIFLGVLSQYGLLLPLRYLTAGSDVLTTAWIIVALSLLAVGVWALLAGLKRTRYGPPVSRLAKFYYGLALGYIAVPVAFIGYATLTKG